MEEIGFLEFIFNHMEAGIEISFFFSSIGIKTVLIFMMYVPIEWSDLVLSEIGCIQSTHGCVTIHGEQTIPSLLAVQSDQSSHNNIARDMNDNNS